MMPVTKTSFFTAVADGTHTHHHRLFAALGQQDVGIVEFEYGLRVVVVDVHREFRRSEVVYEGIK